MYVRVGAHNYEGDIPSLSGSRDCLSRERRYTRSYTCRAVGMLDIRGGPLAYIFTIGFIERAFVNGRVVYSHLLRMARGYRVLVADETTSV